MGDYYDKRMLEELQKTSSYLKQMSKDIHVLTRLIAEGIKVKETNENGENRDFGNRQSGDYIHEIDDGN